MAGAGAVLAIGASTGVAAAGTPGGCRTSGVAVGYDTGYEASSQGYVVRAVDLSGFAEDCGGRTVRLTLADAAGAAVGEASGTVVNGAVRLAVVPAPPAAAVDHLSVVATPAPTR